jgi:UPF0755 protein
VRILVVGVSMLAFAAIGALLYGWYSLTDFLSSPAIGAGEAKVVEIPRQTTLAAAVGVLEMQGLLPKSPWMELYVEHLHLEKEIAPGEYAVSPVMTPVQQLELLESGNVVTYTIAVEAGMTSTQIVGLLADKKLGDPTEISNLINDPAFARSLGIEGPSLEGFLQPDIYDLPRGLDPRELLQRFVARFRNATKEIDFEKTKLRGVSLYEAVIVASLVEKSEVLPEERRFYASMIYDRLKEGIALSSKPANAYGSARTPEGAENLWDTTDRPGLPRTPIASPSLDSLRAATNPAAQHVLYLAPREDGTHVFCPDAECYLEAFKKWKGRYPKGLPRRFQKK